MGVSTSSVEFNCSMNLSGTENVTWDNGKTGSYSHPNFGTLSWALNASSTVVGTAVWDDTRTLAASGDEDLDLKSMQGAGGTNHTVSFAGLKIQAVLIKADADNQGTLTISPSAENAYDLFGDADGQITLAAGMAVCLFGNEQLEDVDDTHKSINILNNDGVNSADYEIRLIGG